MKLRPKIGDHFSDLTVISNISERGKYHVICRCACGNITHVSMYHLLSGNTTSCRCQQSKINNRGPGLTSFRNLYSDYETNAKRRGLKFTLSLEDFTSIVGMNCFYCGNTPQEYNRYLTKDGKQKRKDKKYKTSTIELAIIKRNGIDRKNNSVGYTLENSIPCCKLCNRAKREISFNEFMEWITKLVKHHRT